MENPLFQDEDKKLTAKKKTQTKNKPNPPPDQKTNCCFTFTSEGMKEIILSCYSPTISLALISISVTNSVSSGFFWF